MEKPGLKTSLLMILILLVHSLLCGQRVYYHDSIAGWEEKDPPPEEELVHSVVLIGDVKYPSEDNTMMRLLRKKLDAIPQGRGSLILVGDILYPRGLPEEDEPGFDEGRADLDSILAVIDDFDGHVIFTAGNHDWDKGGEDGWEKVVNAEKYVNSHFKGENIYLPGGGCPGPVEVQVTDDLTVIVFDSQWWFHKYRKPGPDEGCDFEDESDLFVQIGDIIRRNNGKKIIFAAHHPLFSVGSHGGFFPASRLLFPLLDFNKSLYIPLPGFIYTWYRKYLGSIQDLAHPEYKILRSTLSNVFSAYPDLIYAAGHEHNLQYVRKGSLHHIVSGGGGEGTHVGKKKKKTDFAMASPGLSVLKFYANGESWVEYWIPDASAEGKLVFRNHLFTTPAFHPHASDALFSALDFSDSTVKVKLSDIYSKGKFVRFSMGDNYREVWEQPVTLPVFDIGSEQGGLTLLKRGGGQQTRSVRLENGEGRQFVLRSVNKEVEKALDEELRNTLAEDAVQDAISASHPFAALTVPGLAEAAGVMHTNPKIVWVPDDPRLGIYRKDLANGIFLFEERPAGKTDEIGSFGFAEKIVNTPKVIEKTQDDHDHRVDQGSVVRARIFDLFLNDWDRHDDQWRWAAFREEDKTFYRPVPRDRDQVFFVNEGWVMWLASQNFIQPKFQGFDYRIKNVRGLGYNARYFDRSFMTEPDFDQWAGIAGSIKEGLTDSVIEVAVRAFPEEIYSISGPEIVEKLKSRRSNLEEYAAGLYRFLAREVDVVGTNDRELFQVNRLPNGNTEVAVYELSKKKGKLKDLLYKREFVPEETREIRLYGLKGEDKFIVDGEANRAIKVRLIGGKGNDTIIDNSRIRNAGKTLLVYDRKDKKNYIVHGKETKLKLSKDKSVNAYDRYQYKFDKTMPLLNAGYTPDDGIYIGGGVSIKKYNFRDSTRHKIDGTIAFATRAFRINYEGLFSSITPYFDLVVNAGLSMPRNVDNFYGLGNESTKLTNDHAFYRVRYEYAMINPMLKHTVNDNLNYQFGTYYQYFNVSDTAGRFIGDPELNRLDSLAYIRHHFLGVNAGVEIDTRNNKVLPQRGLYWLTEVSAFYGLDENAKNYIKMKSDLRFYLSFTSDPRIVFAFRFGGAMNLGNYEFYQANFLGGKTNLRGFRSNRFAGDHAIYQNTEIRLKLMNLRSYIFNGQTGLYLFNDIGRVWVEEEQSSRWHDGYGVGVWLTPFEFTALTFSYNISYDDKLFALSFKFLF